MGGVEHSEHIFFVCPDEKLEAVFMTNRSDLGGSGSYISEKVEELVFGS